jgi:hypothetical protein
MRDAERWPDLQVSVNLSPVQFRHVDLEGTLRRLIAEHGIEPSRFVLELTEGVLLEATEHINSILTAIRAMGFKIALDDFGTGYSSLSYSAISTSTRSRSTAPSSPASPRSTPRGPSLLRWSRLAAALVWISSPKASRTNSKP